MRSGTVVTFYSYEPQTGSTTVLANVGWCLAAAGRRVLAVDANLATPTLHRYFRPLLASDRLADTLGFADMLAQGRPDPRMCPVGFDFTGAGCLDLVPAHAGAGPATRGKADFPRHPDFPSPVARLIHRLSEGYDYTLVDSEPGSSFLAGACAVETPDVVVLGIRSRYDSIEAAAQVAYSLRDQRAGRPVRIVPVHLLTRSAEMTRLEGLRGFLSRSFADLLGLDEDADGQYWRDMEIPDVLYYGYQRIPAAVSERSGDPWGLAEIYRRIAERVTGGPVAPEPIPEDIRRFLLIRYEPRDPQGPPVTVPRAPTAARPRAFVSYVREDSAVVDKLAAELRAAGIEVWLDRTSLEVGDLWKDRIRAAIRDGDFFIACFSSAYAARSRTYMNEELLVAVEELRLRTRGRRWFLPVVLDGAAVPVHADETLRDFHHVDLAADWDRGVQDLVRVMTTGRDMVAG